MTRVLVACCLILGCSNAERRNGGGGGTGGTGGGSNDTLVVTPADDAIDVDATTLPRDRLSSARPRRQRRHQRLHVLRRGWARRQLQRRDLSSDRHRRRHHARARDPRQRQRLHLAHRAHQEGRDHAGHSVGRAGKIRRTGDGRGAGDGLPARRHAHPAQPQHARGAVHAAGGNDAVRGRLRRARARFEDLHDLRGGRRRLRPDARRGHVEAPQPRVGVDDGRRHAPQHRRQRRPRRQRARAQALVRRRRPRRRPLLLGGRVRDRSFATTSACAIRRPRSSTRPRSRARPAWAATCCRATARASPSA